MTTPRQFADGLNALHKLGRNKMTGEPRIYCTTYCNKGHYVETGKPVSHECIVIPPDALKAEMDGDFEKAISIMKRKGAL